MYNHYSNLRLVGVTFVDNYAGAGGGMQSVYSNLELRDVTFADNRADYTGGGMDNRSGNSVLINVAFFSNSLVGDTQRGGGIHNWEGSQLTLTNGIFSNNIAAYGGGIYNGANSNLTLTNVTFSNNSADYGDGICNEYSGALMLVNSILWGSHSPDEPEIFNSESGTSTISYSLIQGCGGSNNWNIACGVDGGNNIDADPLFINSVIGDLHLQPGSPAIDAGDSDAVPFGVTTDLDGKPRVLDGNGDGVTVVDMGAYEFGYCIYLPLVLREG